MLRLVVTEHLIPIREIPAHYPISLSSLRRLVAAGQIAHYRVGNRIKITQSAMDGWLSGRLIPSKSSVNGLSDTRNPALALLNIARASGEKVNEQTFLDAAAVCDQEVSVE